ncbi:MAG: ribonuclease HII [Muribaculaceae bacterium]|nr:ribonuclease HII [Roseburia sp.]MCM1431265.1 ribonuclease HII [Muribaculaceae bacterium]MCM1492249.1 ribonuclease HII [Muribaculaceae bacterium]
MTEEKETVGAIKRRLMETGENELPAFIEAYGDDGRSGVQALVESAEKRLDKYRRELARTEALKKYEREYDNYLYICGVDEVGRGPLAGPVVAGAVILPKDCDILYINDSKKLSASKREELYGVIMERALAVGIGMAGPGRIDEINILQADYEAMREAVGKLSPRPTLLLNDAVTIPGIDIPQVPIIKGDAKSISIGAASIVAKVTRDRLMEEYQDIYPEYGFASNKGYGSREHIEALKKYGPTPIHRRSFIGNFI